MAGGAAAAAGTAGAGVYRVDVAQRHRHDTVAVVVVSVEPRGLRVPRPRPPSGLTNKQVEPLPSSLACPARRAVLPPTRGRWAVSTARTGPQFFSDALAVSVPARHIYPTASPPLTPPFFLLPHQKQRAHYTQPSSALARLARKSPPTGTMAASAARSFFFFDAEPVGEAGMPAQDACALCSKRLARDSDVFMYRGDTPFCSEECREEQMQLDAVCARQAARRLRQYASGTEARRGHQESRKVSVVS
uniref:Uncharacterized protein n=1 Tax=Avena sativa TaxID=4498 RepID=A0ACD5UV12_AVESA